MKPPLSERELALWISLVTDKLASPKLLAEPSMNDRREVSRRLAVLYLTADAIVEEVGQRALRAPDLAVDQEPARWTTIGTPPWCPYCHRENVQVLSRGAAIMGCSSCLRESLDALGAPT